jgi:hypothetical protein
MWWKRGNKPVVGEDVEPLLEEDVDSENATTV